MAEVGSGAREVVEAARLAYEAGDVDRSESLLLRLADDPVHRAQALYLLGSLAVARDRPEEAEARLKASLATGQVSVATLLALGDIAQRTERTDDAIRWFASAVATDPRNVAAGDRLTTALRGRQGAGAAPGAAPGPGR